MYKSVVVFLLGSGEFLSDNFMYGKAFYILLVTRSILGIKRDKCNENRFASSLDRLGDKNQKIQK